MNVVHLMVSPFYGGPERQVVGLLKALPYEVRSTVLCFPDHRSYEPFVQALQETPVNTIVLEHTWPRAFAVIREIARHLRELNADYLFCHGYKPDILGLCAARMAKVPVVAVSRGWTGATFKVRVYDAADRMAMRWMDSVICVSDGQAEKVRGAGVRTERIHVIRNAIDVARFDSRKTPPPRQLASYFANAPELLVCAAGRFSPEKGFSTFVDAAKLVVDHGYNAGFVLFGDGPLRRELEQRIEAAQLTDRFVMPGHRANIDDALADADVVVIPSFTEGLCNVALEACAAAVPIVATNVGGNPEVVQDQHNGFLVPAGDPAAMAERIEQLLKSKDVRQQMGRHGREHISFAFTFEAQAREYQALMAARR